MADCGLAELLAKLMWVPSGDQADCPASSRGAVSGCSCAPLMSVTQTCEANPWKPNRVKVRCRPSGETAGSKLFVSFGASMKGITRRRWVPSERMIEIVHRPSFGEQRENTICLPSGVYLGW